MSSPEKPEKMTLMQAFNAFSKFGVRDKQQTGKCEMDMHRFVKLCKECGIIETGKLSQADVELLFLKMAPRAPKRISYTTFRDQGIPLLAEASRSTVEETGNKVRYSGGPAVTESSFHSKEGSSETLTRRVSSGSGGGSYEAKQPGDTPLHSSIRRGYASVKSFNSSVKSPLNSSVKSVSSDTPFTLLGGQTMGFIPSQGSGGFTVVKGMDVTCGRIMTSDLRDKEIAGTKPVAGGFAPDSEYKRLWRQKREARGLRTQSELAEKFSSGFTDLRAAMGGAIIEDDDGEDF